MTTSAGGPDATRVRLRADAIAWRQVGDEVVVLDLSRSTYVGVNRTGAVVWPALAVGATRDALVDLITERFDVARAEAAADLDGFLAGLAARGLVYYEREP